MAAAALAGARAGVARAAASGGERGAGLTRAGAAAWTDPAGGRGAAGTTPRTRGSVALTLTRRRRFGPWVYDRPCWSCRGDAAEAPLAARIILQRSGEDTLVELRPRAVEKAQLGVGALPEQEIAQTPLTAGANEEVHGRRGRLRVIDLGEEAQEILRLSGCCALQPPSRLDQAVTRG